jgi:hypothetical protein
LEARENTDDARVEAIVNMETARAEAKEDREKAAAAAAANLALKAVETMLLQLFNANKNNVTPSPVQIYITKNNTAHGQQQVYDRSSVTQETVTLRTNI